MERRLAAIFALDMVGYSRLMGTDETGTLARQKTYYKELIDPAIEKHHGRVFKLMGDGMLAEFASAVDAVECAAEIQRSMPDLEQDVAPDRKIAFRIGINVGDIVVDDGDIYGDGVNVAARIESISDPGSVFISESAFNQVKNKVELGFEDLGLRSVKNIQEPVRVFRVLLDPDAAGSVPGRRKTGGLKHQLLRRRVPQFVGLFLVGSWAFLEFVSFAVEQYGLSPLLPTFVLSILLLLLPTVLWLAWHHGARGPDGWTRADALFLGGNLVAAAGLLFLPGWFEIGDLTTRNLERRDARQTRASALASLEETEDPRRIAVLYFEPRSAGEDVPFLAAGLTEALIDELGAVEALHVVSRNGVVPFRGQGVLADSVGRALRVGTIVDGTVAVSEDQIQVRVEYLNANTGDQFGTIRVERPRTELFQLQADLADEVAIFLRGLLGEELELIERAAGAENVEAWELVQRARAAADQAEALADADETDAAWDQLGASDSLLAAAEQAAPEWVDPTLQRGWLAYTRSRWRGSTEQLEAGRWIDEGLTHARVALELVPGDPEALELRGTLRYWRWLLDLEADTDAAEALFEDAEADLRQAILANPSQAGAWAALSHLVLNKGDTAEGKMAATRAYEADAYLRSADLILWRLYTTSYDLEDQVDATHWCAELGRRFPNEPRFLECQLWSMTMPNAETDVNRAWELAEGYQSYSPPDLVELDRRWSEMAVAAVLARAGLADSTRAVAERARGDATVDPTRDLAYVEAFVRTLLGDNDEALDLLTEYMAVAGRDPSEIDYWWFDGLRDEPRFQMLLGSGGG